MRSLNFPFLSRFIPARRYRTEQSLVGAIDGLNTTFTLPDGDQFVQETPYIQIVVFCNGVRLLLRDDYFVLESGGTGSGYDTVLLVEPPRPGDKLVADYVVV